MSTTTTSQAPEIVVSLTDPIALGTVAAGGFVLICAVAICMNKKK